VIRIVLAEDHAIVREGIAALLGLEPDFALVGEAADGNVAVAMCSELRPDVLLLDMRMPGLDGRGVIEALAATGCLPATLVLTTFEDDSAARAVVRAGARGFLLKDVSRARLVEAVRTLAAGRTMIAPWLTDTIERALGRTEDAPTPLTEREREVLRLMAAGFSNREIAETLAIAEGTAKNHVSNILAKLDTRDRTRAVLRALEHGYI